MNKKKIIVIGGLGMLILAIVFGHFAANSSQGHNLAVQFGIVEETAKPATVKAVKQLTIDEQVEGVLSKMSDGQKIGQMLMIGIQGQNVDDNLRYSLNKYNIGGIILFDWNMDTPQQVQKLTADLQKEAKQAEDLPLFIAVDEEGGQVVRMLQYLTVAPEAEKLGQSGDEQAVADYAHKTAAEIKALGINVNFAPDADLGLSHGRSYSKDPQQAAKFVAAAGAYQADQLLFSLKHFPGIGKSKVDSHLMSSEIMVTRDKLEKEDITPFRFIINSIDNSDFFIMVSHLKYPALDAENPTSLSHAIMQDILRQQLRFNGLIITDDMEMGAVAKLYSFDELGVRAAMPERISCWSAMNTIMKSLLIMACCKHCVTIG